MTEFPVICPHCRGEARAPANAAGKTVDCPACGKQFSIPVPAPAHSGHVQAQATAIPPLPPRQQLPAGKQEVIVTDIRIPFGSMVVLIIKWALAAIPAMIILAVLGLLVSAIFMGGCAAMISAMK